MTGKIAHSSNVSIPGPGPVIRFTGTKTRTIGALANVRASLEKKNSNTGYTILYHAVAGRWQEGRKKY